MHNFSLLHDDIMDRDVERRHRPTAWVVFGEGQAILAGNAMLTAAVDVLVRDGAPGHRALPSLLAAVEGLIDGQSADLDLGLRRDVDLDEVLAMEAGKTAALLACSSSIGALAAGADAGVVDALAAYGYELGMAFQLVDDILGITGDAAATGKSSSSDVRAGKRSAPIVAALTSGTAASEQLARMLAGGPLVADDDVTQRRSSSTRPAALSGPRTRPTADSPSRLGTSRICPPRREQLPIWRRWLATSSNVIADRGGRTS